MLGESGEIFSAEPSIPTHLIFATINAPDHTVGVIFAERDDLLGLLSFRLQFCNLCLEGINTTNRKDQTCDQRHNHREYQFIQLPGSKRPGPCPQLLGKINKDRKQASTIKRFPVLGDQIRPSPASTGRLTVARQLEDTLVKPGKGRLYGISQQAQRETTKNGSYKR